MKRVVLFLLVFLTATLLLPDGLTPAHSPRVLATETGNKALLSVLLTHPNRGAALLCCPSSWDKDTFPSALSGMDVLLSRPITDKVWFIMGFDYQWDFNDGSVIRTKDGGATWTTIGRPGTNDWWQDFAADANGRLWGLTLDITTNIYGTAKVWYSDDNGDNWSLSLSHTATPNVVRMYRLVTHPSNPYVVAAYGRYNNTQHRVLVTQNRGQTWTTNTSSNVAPEISNGQESDLVMTNSGRLVVSEWRNSPKNNMIVTSDDFGQSWTLRQELGLITSGHHVLGPVGKPNGSTLYVLRVDASVSPPRNEVWQSTNEGTSWSAFSSLVPIYDATHMAKGGIAYDPLEDALYVADRGGISVNQKLVMKMTPPTSSGTWQDVSYDLVPFGSFSTYSITEYGQHIAIVPGKRLDYNLGGPGDNTNTIYSTYLGNLATGNSWSTRTDIAIPGRGLPLEFTRSHNAYDGTAGPLGYGWSFNYGMRLVIDRSDPAETRVTRLNERGGRVVFVENPDGSYSSPGWVFETLTENADQTFILTLKNQLKYNFNSNGKLTSTTDRNNNTTTLNYTGNLLTSVTDAGGRSLTFTYDGSNRIFRITDPLPAPNTRTVEFTYDSNGDLTQVKDTKGGYTTYAYDKHRITSVTDPNSHVALRNTYDNAGRVVEQKDAADGVTCIYYGTVPSYSSTACPGVTPAPTSSQTITVDSRGNKKTSTFNLSTWTSKVSDHLGNSIVYTYNTTGNPICVTDQRGKKTGLAYDSQGNLTQLIDALNTDANCLLKAGGAKWTFAYTATNDIDLITDPIDYPNGRKLDLSYDSTGNLTRIISKDASGTVKALTCLEVDASGQVTGAVESTDLIVPAGPTDPCAGNRAKFGYDSYGNQTCATNPRFSSPSGACDQMSTKATFGYDLAGRKLTSANELGHVTTYTYDAQNSLLTQTDHLGNTSSNTYDGLGSLKTVTHANRQPVGPAEAGSQCGTAGTGNNVDDDSDGAKDDGCPSAIYGYDNKDRLVSVIDAGGHTTSYGYDASDNLTSATTAKRQAVGVPETGTQCGTAGTGNNVDDDSDGTNDDGCPSRKYSYDGLNRLQSATDPLGRVVSYQYDAASNLTQLTDARGLVTKYFPDDKNRLDLVEHWNGSTLVDNVDYTYDAVDNRLTMVDSTGITNYQYDALNRPTSVTFPGPKTVSYQYDSPGGGGGPSAAYPGQRTKITYPDNKTVIYTYEPDGRLKSATDWLSKQTVYSYDSVGKLTKAEFPNSTWSDYGYDADDRLTSVINKKTGPTTISSFTYTLDKVGNRTQLVDLAGTHTYQYDALQRLTQATYPGPQTDSYTYDALGNRLTKNSTTYTYDAADQMLTAGGVSYGYDNNGNQTSRGADTFTYNHENLLTQSVVGGVTSSSTYNGDGLRVTHTVAGQTTNHTWDVASELPLVLQDNSNTFVYGIGLISTTNNSGMQTYYLSDGLGSTTDLRDGSGDSVASYSYDVFGAIRSQTGSSNSDRLFTGEQRDSDSALYYLRARYYDPAIGRFVGQDRAIGDGLVPQSLNRYAYVGNNPVNFTDPSGMVPELPYEVTVQWLVDQCVPLPAGTQGPCVAQWVRANQDFLQNVLLPYLRQCVVWGAAGFLFNQVSPISGAIAGCVAGMVGQALADNGMDNPGNGCTVWAYAGLIATRGRSSAAVAGCVAGAASWVDSEYGPNTWWSECLVWGIAGYGGASGDTEDRAAIGATTCAAAIFSSFWP